MKKLLTVLVSMAMFFSMGLSVLAAEDDTSKYDDWQKIEEITRNFLKSYLYSVYIDENVPVDYSDFVDNDDLINYMEAKKSVYRLTEKYFGEVVDYDLSIFGIGTQGTYVHGEFHDAPIYFGESYFNNSDGEDVNLVGPMVFTFIEVDGELKIYGVYSLDIVDRSVRGYSREGTGLPTIYSDMSDELNAFAADFEKKLAYYSENEAQIAADEKYCTDLAIDYLTNYYDELYTQEETDGIFEHELKIESGELASYLQKIAYYENSPKRYGKEIQLTTRELKLNDIFFWDKKIYLSVSCNIQVYNRKYPKMVLSQECETYYFTFVLNENDEYVLRDLYSINGFDRLNRELSKINDANFADYMQVEPVVTFDLLKVLDEAQLVKDASLKKESEKEVEAEEPASEVGENLTLTESPEISEDPVDVTLFGVFVIGSFVFSAVAAGLSIVLVLKKK